MKKFDKENKEMDFQTIISNEVDRQRQEELKISPQLLLGELILKLEAVNTPCKDGSEKEVRFDFGYFRPTNLDSWRGIYAELALGYSETEKDITVNELIKILKEAIGKTYTGYKGGDFVMGKNTPIWVSNYSESPSTGIIGVKDLGWLIILQTDWLEC